MTYWNQVVWEEVGWPWISKFRRKESVKIWNLYSLIEGCSEDSFNWSSIGLSIQEKILKSREKPKKMGIKIADTENHNTGDVWNAQIIRFILNSGGWHGPCSCLLTPSSTPFRSFQGSPSSPPQPSVKFLTSSKEGQVWTYALHLERRNGIEWNNNDQWTYDKVYVCTHNW